MHIHAHDINIIGCADMNCSGCSIRNPFWLEFGYCLELSVIDSILKSQLLQTKNGSARLLAVPTVHSQPVLRRPR